MALRSLFFASLLGALVAVEDCNTLIEQLQSGSETAAPTQRRRDGRSRRNQQSTTAGPPPGAEGPQPANRTVPPFSGAARGAPARRLPFSPGDMERIREVNVTLDLIEQHGPFPYRQDGVVFQNRENRLPNREYGYYHEYTVRTPQLTHRGTRRLITGTYPETWYTDDHYQTFVVIDPRRYSP
jgi:ribonuclease T1